MSDDLRAKIDWSQWKLCTLSGVPDETHNRGIQYYMYPLIVTWHNVSVPMFDTEEQAMQWVIDGGQFEIKLKYDEEGKPIRRGRKAYMNDTRYLVIDGFCILSRDRRDGRFVWIPVSGARR